MAKPKHNDACVLRPCQNGRRVAQCLARIVGVEMGGADLDPGSKRRSQPCGCSAYCSLQRAWRTRQGETAKTSVRKRQEKKKGRIAFFRPSVVLLPLIGILR